MTRMPDFWGDIDAALTDTAGLPPIVASSMIAELLDAYRGFTTIIEADAEANPEYREKLERALIVAGLLPEAEGTS